MHDQAKASLALARIEIGAPPSAWDLRRSVADVEWLPSKPNSTVNGSRAMADDIDDHGAQSNFLDEKLKCKEQWLREELRTAQSLYLKCIITGLTSLAVVMFNIYSVRKDMQSH